MAKKTVSALNKTAQVNTFTGGINTDLHPILQPNDTLSDCLNGTLITYNGNENMLQNDMGNYALKNAKLPVGYLPMGMKEYGGILYLVSYNPVTGKMQIGSYPSPQTIFTEGDASDFELLPINITGSEKDSEYIDSDGNLTEKGIEWVFDKIEGKEIEVTDVPGINFASELSESKVVFTNNFQEDSMLAIGDEYILEVDDYTNILSPDVPYDQFIGFTEQVLPFQELQYFLMQKDGSEELLKNDPKYNHISSNTYSAADWETKGWLGAKYTLPELKEFDVEGSFKIKEPTYLAFIKDVSIENNVLSVTLKTNPGYNVVPDISKGTYVNNFLENALNSYDSILFYNCSDDFVEAPISSGESEEKYYILKDSDKILTNTHENPDFYGMFGEEGMVPVFQIKQMNDVFVEIPKVAGYLDSSGGYNIDADSGSCVTISNEVVFLAYYLIWLSQKDNKSRGLLFGKRSNIPAFNGAKYRENGITSDMFIQRVTASNFFITVCEFNYFSPCEEVEGGCVSTINVNNTGFFSPDLIINNPSVLNQFFLRDWSINFGDTTIYPFSKSSSITYDEHTLHFDITDVDKTLIDNINDGYIKGSVFINAFANILSPGNCFIADKMLNGLNINYQYDFEQKFVAGGVKYDVTPKCKINVVNISPSTHNLHAIYKITNLETILQVGQTGLQNSQNIVFNEVKTPSGTNIKQQILPMLKCEFNAKWYIFVFNNNLYSANLTVTEKQPGFSDDVTVNAFTYTKVDNQVIVRLGFITSIIASSEKILIRPVYVDNDVNMGLPISINLSSTNENTAAHKLEFSFDVDNTASFYYIQLLNSSNDTVYRNCIFPNIDQEVAKRYTDYSQVKWNYLGVNARLEDFFEVDFKDNGIYYGYYGEGLASGPKMSSESPFLLPFVDGYDAAKSQTFGIHKHGKLHIKQKTDISNEQLQVSINYNDGSSHSIMDLKGDIDNTASVYYHTIAHTFEGGDTTTVGLRKYALQNTNCGINLDGKVMFTDDKYITENLKSYCSNNEKELHVIKADENKSPNMYISFVNDPLNFNQEDENYCSEEQHIRKKLKDVLSSKQLFTRIALTPSINGGFVIPSVRQDPYTNYQVSRYKKYFDNSKDTGLFNSVVTNLYSLFNKTIYSSSSGSFLETSDIIHGYLIPSKKDDVEFLTLPLWFDTELIQFNARGEYEKTDHLHYGYFSGCSDANGYKAYVLNPKFDIAQILASRIYYYISSKSVANSLLNDNDINKTFNKIAQSVNINAIINTPVANSFLYNGLSLTNISNQLGVVNSSNFTLTDDKIKLNFSKSFKGYEISEEKWNDFVKNIQCQRKLLSSSIVEDGFETKVYFDFNKSDGSGEIVLTSDEKMDREIKMLLTNFTDRLVYAAGADDQHRLYYTYSTEIENKFKLSSNNGRKSGIQYLLRYSGQTLILGNCEAPDTRNRSFVLATPLVMTNDITTTPLTPNIIEHLSKLASYPFALLSMASLNTSNDE